ncbi:MAG: preprotein translocase subunit YajC [Clostridium sp.]|jgi:preprotein translocase subunit YajC|nr:preprotein translocase subunit YajC [Clostridium sp.]
MVILAGGTSAMLVSLLPLVAMFAIMYFLIMRPEKKRKEAYRLMLSQLAVNDEVITKGGLVGKIIRLDDENMVLETGPDRVRLRMMKDAIFTKVNKDVSIKVERS